MRGLNKLYTKEYFQKRDVLPLHFAIILRFYLQNLGLKKVLDVGCGTGKLVSFLKKSGFEAIGCDQSDEAIKISGQIKAKATSLPFKENSFEAVLAISLIEHLNQKEAQKFTKEAYRILRNKGVVFLETPNLLSPLRLAMGKNWYAYSDPTHVTFYTPLKLIRLLKQAGFKHFHFWFKIPQKPTFAYPFFNFAHQLPKKITDFISFLLISTPLTLLREGIWLSAEKPTK